MCHIILLLPFLALPLFFLLPIQFAALLSSFILVVSFMLYFKAKKAMELRPISGKDAMLGKVATVIEKIDPEGKIRCNTEIWNARNDRKTFEVGDRVIIKGFHGMDVLVEEAPHKGGAK